MSQKKIKQKRAILPKDGYVITKTLLEHYAFFNERLAGTELSPVVSAIQEAKKIMWDTKTGAIKTYYSILNYRYFKEPEKPINQPSRDVRKKRVCAVSLFGYHLFSILNLKCENPGERLDYALNTLEISGHPVPYINRQALSNHYSETIMGQIRLVDEDAVTDLIVEEMEGEDLA